MPPSMGQRRVSHKTERPKDTKYVLLRLWKYLYRYKMQIFMALLLSAVSNILVIIAPMLSGHAIDAIALGKGKVDFDTVIFYVVWMAVFYIVSAILSYCLSVIMMKISRKTVNQMRKDIFQKLMELPVGYFDTHQTGDIISRMMYDVDTINTSLATDVIQVLTSIITVIGSLVMMIKISPILVLVMIVTIPLSIWYTSTMFRKVRPLFGERSSKFGHFNSFVEEMISGHKTTKAYTRETNVINKFDDINEKAAKAYYDAEYCSSIVGPSVNGIANLSLTLVSIFGAILYLYGKMSLGNISSFVLYSRKFSGPINETANLFSELQSACAAAERVFRLIDEESEVSDIEGALELEGIQGNLKIDNISFGYNKDKMIIKNLSFQADQGKVVAIVGPTGAGKTTIINLLMRFYDVYEGHISVDGHEITEVTRKSLREAYAMVLQDTWLFQGTIFDNIAYGNENATMEEVIEVAKIAKIHSYIKRLPEGYHTILNEDGINISKGQKQLLTIARAMLLDAKMLILDEATSNVDTRTEIQIQQAMHKLMDQKTCFVIAHRLSTIQNADLILVVQDGNVIEQGTHEKLMKQKGFYYELYHSQFD